MIECDKVNGYGRKLDDVLLARLRRNRMQVHSGLAWHFKQNQREQSAINQQRYAGAETEARAAKLGLWRDVEPIPPWVWRKKGD